MITEMTAEMREAIIEREAENYPEDNMSDEGLEKNQDNIFDKDEDARGGTKVPYAKIRAKRNVKNKLAKKSRKANRRRK